MQFSFRFMSALVATVAIGSNVYVQNVNAQAFKVDENNPTKITTNESDRGELGTRCTFTLRRALNAAISELMAEDSVLITLLATYSTVPYFPLLTCPAQSGHTSFFKYPEYDEDELTSMVEDFDALPATAESGDSQETFKFYDILEEILVTGVLKVVGSGYDSNGTIVGFNWGNSGNYSIALPTGFFVDYLNLIVAKISTHYTRPIIVEYIYAVKPLELLTAGTAHMTDLYMVQGSSTTNGASPVAPVQTMDTTCPIIGADYSIVSLSSAQIATLENLNSAIESAATEAEKTIIFRTQANLEAMKPFLATAAILQVYAPDDAVSFETKVANSSVLAGIQISDLDPTVSTVAESSSGITTSLGPWLAKKNFDFCIWNEYSGSPITAAVNLIVLTLSIATASYYMYF